MVEWNGRDLWAPCKTCAPERYLLRWKVDRDPGSERTRDVKFAVWVCRFHNQVLSVSRVPGTVLGTVHKAKQAPDLGGTYILVDVRGSHY